MARPTKLTPESSAQIIKAISAGATRVDAAHSSGVDYFTFLRWMDRGNKATKGIFREFCEAVTAAEAEVRVSLANALAVAAKTDWRAAEAYLKRRDPSNWGDKQTITVNPKDAFIKALTDAGLTIDDIRSEPALAALAAVAGVDIGATADTGDSGQEKE